MISKGNVVAVEILVEGTHKGEFLGIPATDKKIEIPIVWFIDFNEEGKIERVIDYWNERRFIAQVCEIKRTKKLFRILFLETTRMLIFLLLSNS